MTVDHVSYSTQRTLHICIGAVGVRSCSRRNSMGCSRVGALAVACVLIAGVLSMLAMLLPYWSKLSVEIEDQGQLELTVGLWGSCFNMRPLHRTPLDSPVVMNGTEVIAIEPENAVSDLLTCGSYFDQEAIHISCTSFRQLASGQCQRHEYEAGGTLCDRSVAVSFIGHDVRPAVISNWLGFLEIACGKTGHASIFFGLLSSIFTGVCIVVLLFGITCARVNSRLIHFGLISAGFTAACQVTVTLLWATETRRLDGKGQKFGTSFYLNVITIFLHSVACVAAKKHQNLEAEAHAETLADWIVEKAASGADRGKA